MPTSPARISQFLFAVVLAVVVTSTAQSTAALSPAASSIAAPSTAAPSTAAPSTAAPSTAVPVTATATVTGARIATAQRATWPTDAPHSVVRPFAATASPYSAGHRGIDIAAAEGQPVYAIAAGTVFFAGVVVDRPLISIAHGDGLVSSLEPVAPLVTPGEAVSAGQQIGIVAHPSHCDHSCLHLGVRLDGAYLSPLLLLTSVPRSVLLPDSPPGSG